MATRARRVLTLTLLIATIIVMALSGATTASADDTVEPRADADASGQVITVTVWGDGYRGGAAGSGGGGRESLRVPAPCWMSAWSTGREYYEYVRSGQMGRDNHHYSETMTPLPEYEKYKDDDKGHWYSAECASENWPDQNDMPGWSTFVTEYFAAHTAKYYPASTLPPLPPVPPALLRDIAIRNLTLPDPELDWNPRRIVNQGTLVNLDTWFWLDNAPTTLAVHAEAGASRASVTATFGGMDITAPGEAPLSCTGPNTPYVSGALGTSCALAFSQSSVALGTQKTPVTVKTRWTGTWAANGVDQGLITPQPDPDATTVDIRVDEVQALVTGAR